MCIFKFWGFIDPVLDQQTSFCKFSSDVACICLRLMLIIETRIYNATI